MSQVKLMRELLGKTNWASLGLVRTGLVTKVNLGLLIQPIRKWTHSILSHKFYWIGKQFRKQRNFEDDSDIQWLQQLDSDQQRDLTSPAAVLVRGYEGQVPLQSSWGTTCWPGHPHLSWLCRERPVASYLTLSDCEWSDLYVCPLSQPRNSEGKHHLQHPSTFCKNGSIFWGSPYTFIMDVVLRKACSSHDRAWLRARGYFWTILAVTRLGVALHALLCP